MTKETISTFLPIVNIRIRAKPVKSKAANPEIKLFKSAFFSYRPWIPYHIIDSLQSCISITWDVWPLVPFLVRCVVSTVYAHRIFVELDRFSKIFFFIRYWTMEKRKSEKKRNHHCTAGPNQPPKGLFKATFTYFLHFFSFLDQTCQTDFDCWPNDIKFLVD